MMKVTRTTTFATFAYIEQSCVHLFEHRLHLHHQHEQYLVYRHLQQHQVPLSESVVLHAVGSGLVIFVFELFVVYGDDDDEQ